MWLACGLLSIMLMATGCRTHTPNWWTYKYLRSQLFLFSNNVGSSSGRTWPSFLGSVPTVAGTASARSELNITKGNQVSVECPLGKDVSDPGWSHWPYVFSNIGCIWVSRLTFRALPLGFWSTDFGFPTCISQMMVSIGVTKVYMVLTILLSCLHRICEFQREGFLRV